MARSVKKHTMVNVDGREITFYRRGRGVAFTDWDPVAKRTGNGWSSLNVKQFTAEQASFGFSHLKAQG